MESGKIDKTCAKRKKCGPKKLELFGRKVDTPTAVQEFGKLTNGSNLMNPQLDHWLPKSKFPLLQLSFFNLIPSCEICNTRVKKTREFMKDVHVHPYDFTYEELKFTYFFDKKNQ